MKRLALGLVVVLANLGVGASTRAQEPAASEADDSAASDGKAAAGGEAPAADVPEAKEELPDLSDEVKEAESSTKEGPADATVARRSWEDIVVVPRKAFLKAGRLEFAPFTGVSTNDVMIRHYSFGGDLNFYLTDVFSIGLEGQYFIKERSKLESVVGLQFNRVTTLNKFKQQVALTFGYVPAYGKFGLFNKYIIHWDVNVTAGIGWIWTEIIPRVIGDETFGTQALAPRFGVGARMFVRDWLTLGISVRDYVFQDKFEPLNRNLVLNQDTGKLEPVSRQDQWSMDQVKANALTSVTQNIMVMASIGFYLPTSFTYKTPR